MKKKESHKMLISPKDVESIKEKKITLVKNFLTPRVIASIGFHQLI
jgi:hypothetical protein